MLVQPLSPSDSLLHQNASIIFNGGKVDPEIQKIRESLDLYESEKNRIDILLTLKGKARVDSFSGLRPSEYDYLRLAKEEEVKSYFFLLWNGLMLLGGGGSIAGSYFLGLMSMSTATAIGAITVLGGAFVGRLFLNVFGKKLWYRSMDSEILRRLKNERQNIEQNIAHCRELERQAIFKHAQQLKNTDCSASLLDEDKPQVVLLDEEQSIEIDGVKLKVR